MSSHQLISLASGLSLVTALVVLVSRWSAGARAPERPSVALPTFEYRAHGGSGWIDQTLAITNPNAVDVAPVLAFTPVDADGRALRKVRVATAYGSDRGELVVHPDGGFDVLNFSGPDADRVADVRVTVTKLLVLPAAGPSGYIEAKPTRGGEAVSRFATFDAVVLENPHPEPVTRRVVHLVYDSPRPGASQQVVHVTPIGDLAVVPPEGHLVVPVTPPVAALIRDRGAGQAVSLKTYPSR
ncbi:hypothetical protein [Kitasatospora sp. NPDC048538]|uniref:hypothetical protein n=1 Tax=unclassified Kitasatospora TaxID=2633591 RepID=UPI00340624A5